MEPIDPSIAQLIINQVGGSGQPPRYGVQYFTAGLDGIIDDLQRKYFRGYLRGIGSDVKLVVGIYGSGKTHFLYSVRDLAWQNNFVVSYVSLSKKESPFHRLDLVYKKIVGGIIPPLPPEELIQGDDEGIDMLIRYWYSQRLQEHRQQGLRGDRFREAMLDELTPITGIKEPSFESATKAAFEALLDNDDDGFANACGWLKGDFFNKKIHERNGIRVPVNERNAMTMIRSLSQWVRKIGFNGLIILLDEAEFLGGLSTKETDNLLSNLRELVDACGQHTFIGTLVCYAVPDVGFLEGRGPHYEALRQRLTTIFSRTNPTGVRIVLDAAVDQDEALDFMREVGGKLAWVYNCGYGTAFEQPGLGYMIDKVAAHAYERRFSDQGYKRIFVQKLVEGLHFYRIQGGYPSDQDLLLD